MSSPLPTTTSTTTMAIWFQLVDADENAYKGTKSDTVLLPPGSDVVDFRDAVKAKFAESHLKGVDASDLIVFQNTKEQPLEEDAHIGIFGASKKDALIVVVPPLDANKQAFDTKKEPLDDEAPVMGRDQSKAVVADQILRRLLETSHVLPGDARVCEGVYLRLDPYAPRTELIEKIVYTAERKGLVMIRAPPMTGKTSTWTLLAHHLNQKENTIAFRMSPVGFSDMNFETVFERQIGIKWDDFLYYVSLSTLRIFFLLDEAQVYFPKVDGTFPRGGDQIFSANEMKGNLQRRLKVVVFSAFGQIISKSILSRISDIVTPPSICPEDILSHSSIAFTEQDGHDYLKELASKQSWPIAEDIRNKLVPFVLCFTNGHAGLFTQAFRDLYNICRKNIRDYQFEELRDVLMSSDFRMTWSGNRACYPVREISAGSREDQVLSTICFTGGLTKAEIVSLSLLGDDDVDQSIAFLIQHFLLVEDVLPQNNSKFAFSANLIQDCYLRYKYRKTMKPGHQKLDFDTFIQKVLATIDGYTLKHCLSRSKNDRLLEAAFQKEFYRAAFQLLGDGVISCEPGALFGVKGFIDFWINNDRKWAIELLRDSDHLYEHANWMTKHDHDKYNNLAMNANRTLLIDLRALNSSKAHATKHQPEGCVLAVFDEKFSFVILTKKTENGEVSRN